MSKKSDRNTTFTVLPALGFGVELQIDSHYVRFNAYKMFNQDGKWHLHAANAPGQPAPTDVMEDAEVFVEGSVKWDGCANFNFPDSCYHTCDRSQLLDIGRVLVEIHKLCAAAMPETWQGEDDSPKRPTSLRRTPGKWWC